MGGRLGALPRVRRTSRPEKWPRSGVLSLSSEDGKAVSREEVDKVKSSMVAAGGGG